MSKKVEFEVTVYTYQIDFAGHVSNIVYLRWMEMARSKLLEAAGLPVETLLARGIVPVLASGNPLQETALSRRKGSRCHMALGSEGRFRPH